MKKIHLLGIVFLIASCSSSTTSSETLSSGDEIIKSQDSKVHVTKFNQDFETEQADNLNSEALNLAKAGKFSEANKIFSEALEIEPNNPVLLSNLGLVSNALGKYEDAVNYFEQSLVASDSTYVAAAANLGMTHYQNKEYIKSISISEFVVKNSEDATNLGSAYLNITACYVALKDCEKGKESLKNLELVLGKVSAMSGQISSLQYEIEQLCTTQAKTN